MKSEREIFENNDNNMYVQKLRRSKCVGFWTLISFG